ncbi:MAG: twin-arginine translocase TatA/TatE family subunit [Alphaproteobacteria bacterium]|jgi:sec-independent protein translocase protein TatA|nr:twin-arginine translocase TatA/TatE family subunit [Rhodospirillaceae bacterium]MDP6020486.1 twin-arginine translocase TatA/TatE family subunit [Alphaproteobacteria bacterium]MDP6254230.1 twin-arginine translocase TatA/TatE family subunit [Alphaproteobacteria bacterium]MDP7052692.1 twin-arginine translocase TatA/TatE family subunit [Alphaproteobacteria bacterium]MDP7229810.1 twin-arginine translocase TatA/TatE family subunit [Alphaproteobacteria bacterium]|tara:strand:- start:365 stop:595 length:231 start_codon:yes stop_codon:yes gene_type:complete
MGLSFWQIAIVVLLVVLLFGRGKLSALMGDMAKGIKSFKAGMAEEEKVVSAPQESLDGDDAKPVQSSAAEDETAKS